MQADIGGQQKEPGFNYCVSLTNTVLGSHPEQSGLLVEVLLIRLNEETLNLKPHPFFPKKVQENLASSPCLLPTTLTKQRHV